MPSPIERLFTARLNGASQVPSNASVGTGYGRVVLNAAENQIRFNDGTSTERSWGLGGDVTAIGDYDGDGKTDYAVFRQSNGIFYIIKSSDNTVQTIPFGQSGDKILIADYTGDGKDDVAITRASQTAGVPLQFWYFASSGPFAGRQVEQLWGITGDTPVSGDYNGDGKADFTVERGVSGQAVFYTRLGSDGAVSPGPDRQTAFGLSTDTFVPGDYDGDGKTDIAVTRNQANQIVWYYQPSTGGPYQQQAWGTFSTDSQEQERIVGAVSREAITKVIQKYI